MSALVGMYTAAWVQDNEDVVHYAGQNYQHALSSGPLTHATLLTRTLEHQGSSVCNQQLTSHNKHNLKGIQLHRH